MLLKLMFVILSCVVILLDERTFYTARRAPYASPFTSIFIPRGLAAESRANSGNPYRWKE